MTTATPLYKRVQEADEALASRLAMMVTNLTIAGAGITNNVTRHDYLQALYKLFVALELPFKDEERAKLEGKVRPAATPADERPLFLRLDAEQKVAQTVKPTLIAFNMLQAMVTSIDQETGDELFRAYQRFGRDLGLPTTAEREANPELYPGVSSKLEVPGFDSVVDRSGLDDKTGEQAA